MDWVSTEKKDGYSVWTNSAGEEYLVIEGLDPNQIHTPGAIESFLVEHYSLFETAYWVLIALTFTFLVTRFIIIPLSKRNAEDAIPATDE